MKLEVFETDRSQTIDDTIELIRQRAANEHFSHNGVYICNISDLIDKFRVWKRHLPRVKPFYGTETHTYIHSETLPYSPIIFLFFRDILAVKVNNSPGVLETLAALGAGFDCASKGIQRIKVW